MGNVDMDVADGGWRVVCCAMRWACPVISSPSSTTLYLHVHFSAWGKVDPIAYLIAAGREIWGWIQGDERPGFKIEIMRRKAEKAKGLTKANLISGPTPLPVTKAGLPNKALTPPIFALSRRTRRAERRQPRAMPVHRPPGRPPGAPGVPTHKTPAGIRAARNPTAYRGRHLRRYMYPGPAS